MRHEDIPIQMVQRLTDALGNRLTHVVLYGDEHLLIVVADLDVQTMRRLAEPVRWWLKQGEPWPRLFTPELLRASADIYPIELLEISRHHRLLFGGDPLAGITVEPAHLRMQCERELREKLMRLREGYVECHGDDRRLHDLLAVSYPSFVRIFRACLHLLGAPPVERDRDVVAALAARLDLPPLAGALAAVERIAGGDRDGDADAHFAAYYRALTGAEDLVDRFLFLERKSP